MIIKLALVSFIALAAGIAVGTGFVAFITVLGIIPRLMQLTKTMNKIIHYEWATILGVVLGSWFDLYEPKFTIYPDILGLIGLLYGVFVGMLAAALYEVLNVFPIITKRIKLQGHLHTLLMALVLGKVFGALLYWVYFIDFP